jgi:hypothetical protein
VDLLKSVSGVSGAADATIREVCKTLYIYSERILPVRYVGSDLTLLLQIKDIMSGVEIPQAPQRTLLAQRMKPIQGAN